MKYDVVIIGAGIIGSLIADKLAKYDLSIAVLEKEIDGGLEQSMSSSAIVHSGIDPKGGTLKAKYNVKGNRMMKELCEDLNVDYLNCGGYMCATNKEELMYLNQALEIGHSRGIECYIISGEELRNIESNVSINIKYALVMPTTAVVYPVEIVIAALERAMDNGVEVLYNHRVANINYDGSYKITCDGGIEIDSDYVINCAGMYSDQIAKMLDKGLDVTITPKRGEYFVTNNRKPVVHSVIYPVPNENGKGVLAVPTTHGNVLLGPNGVIQENREDDGNHSDDLMYVQENVNKLLDKFPRDIIKTYAGLRTRGNDGDFYIKKCRVTPKMINLIAIDSPGLASSPAISEEAKNWVVADLDTNVKETYVSERLPYFSMKKINLDEQNEIIKNDSNFGKIICRCEQVTEGEIRAAIRKQNGARDLTGIKFRIRPMLGMCQGGFCETEVVRILADELGVEIDQIKRRGNDTVVIRGGNDETV